MAAARTCMNASCGTSTSIRWRKGWALRSGEFIDLCDKCGSAYENSTFCDTFHSKDSGWRECALCGKRLHCGCVASQFQLELLDTGGVSCMDCAKKSGLKHMASNGNPDGFGTCRVENLSRLELTPSDNQLNGNGKDKMDGVKLGSGTEHREHRHLLQLQLHNNESNGSLVQTKQEGILPSTGELGSTLISKLNQVFNGSHLTAKVDNIGPDIGTKDLFESLSRTNLSITLGASLGNSNSFPSTHVAGREYSKTSPPIYQGPRSRHLLPKPPARSTISMGLDSNTGLVPQIHVVRPPAEGRGRNQLLPRYWPRITNQELQQISGDSNSTIVPLFEKMLSASDAGRIGRLVLPKACAEAYFPPISQPEGLPIRIQDVKGKEWVFQFRFWPNNNSRMYVLEGVTPCIQSMQLQAGDTVTFSRKDPEGKLIMGFRKASNSAQIQPLKGSAELHLNSLSKQWNPAGSNINWYNGEKSEGRTREDLLLPQLLPSEKRKARNIGSKSKRLLIDVQDALELKLTWEEAQDLLRPPPTVKPSIVMIEDHVFEEYDEPPIFGKRSIFVVSSNGVQEQWAQCDSCSKWRRLPVDLLLPPKWTCVDNSWDQSRCSCSAPDELTPSELENLLRLKTEFKRRRMAESHRAALEHESSGLDALADAAILGDNVGDSGTTSVATTTKHPRHRPGCSCIVCIQPPSGKGKHKPTCTCQVCMTVKRRFKTLMMRKKKRQSDCEAEIAQRHQQATGHLDEPEIQSTSRHLPVQLGASKHEIKVPKELDLKSSTDMIDTGKGHLDLNCHPNREDVAARSKAASMMSLLQEASLPLDTYLKQNGLASLISEQEVNSASNVQVGEGQNNEESCPVSAQEPESGDEGETEPEKSQNDSIC